MAINNKFFMRIILIFNIFLIAKCFNTFPSMNDMCENSCLIKYRKQEDLSICSRGCRLFHVIDKSAINERLEVKQNGCIEACEGAYKENVEACNVGCKYGMESSVSQLIPSPAVMDGNSNTIPCLFKLVSERLRSLFNGVRDRGFRFLGEPDSIRAKNVVVDDHHDDLIGGKESSKDGNGLIGLNPLSSSFGLIKISFPQLWRINGFSHSDIENPVKTVLAKKVVASDLNDEVNNKLNGKDLHGNKNMDPNWDIFTKIKIFFCFTNDSGDVKPVPPNSNNMASSMGIFNNKAEKINNSDKAFIIVSKKNDEKLVTKELSITSAILNDKFIKVNDGKRSTFKSRFDFFKFDPSLFPFPFTSWSSSDTDSNGDVTKKGDNLFDFFSRILPPSMNNNNNNNNNNNINNKGGEKMAIRSVGQQISNTPTANANSNDVNNNFLNFIKNRFNKSSFVAGPSMVGKLGSGNWFESGGLESMGRLPERRNLILIRGEPFVGANLFVGGRNYMKNDNDDDMRIGKMVKDPFNSIDSFDLDLSISSRIQHLHSIWDSLFDFPALSSFKQRSGLKTKNIGSISNFRLGNDIGDDFIGDNNNNNNNKIPVKRITSVVYDPVNNVIRKSFSFRFPFAGRNDANVMKRNLADGNEMKSGNGNEMKLGNGNDGGVQSNNEMKSGNGKVGNLNPFKFGFGFDDPTILMRSDFNRMMKLKVLKSGSSDPNDNSNNKDIDAIASYEDNRKKNGGKDVEDFFSDGNFVNIFRVNDFFLNGDSENVRINNNNNNPGFYNGRNIKDMMFGEGAIDNGVELKLLNSAAAGIKDGRIQNGVIIKDGRIKNGVIIKDGRIQNGMMIKDGGEIIGNDNNNNNNKLGNLYMESFSIVRFKEGGRDLMTCLSGKLGWSRPVFMFVFSVLTFGVLWYCIGVLVGVICGNKGAVEAEKDVEFGDKKKKKLNIFGESDDLLLIDDDCQFDEKKFFPPHYEEIRDDYIYVQKGVRTAGGGPFILPPSYYSLVIDDGGQSGLSSPIQAAKIKLNEV